MLKLAEVLLNCSQADMLSLYQDTWLKEPYIILASV